MAQESRIHLPRQETWVLSLGQEAPLKEEMPGKSQGQRSLAGYSPWGRRELDVTLND